MTATINDLRRATDSPATHFRRLGRAVRRGGIVRTSYFAEARMALRSEEYTLFMPLHEKAMTRVERFAPLRRHLVSPAVPQIEILCDEMSYDDALMRRATCDIVAERLPQGRPLGDVVAAIFSDGDAAALIDALERELRRADVSHNNLRPENILIDDNGALYPIRWIYATDGAGGDSEALDSLRERITRMGAVATAENEPCERFDPYGPAIEGAYGVGTLEEGLAPVETEQGWGFVDGEGRIAIEARFMWVGGFREGRAEVQTLTGMGLIDKSGRYVIEPVFDIVDYDPETGNSQVRRGDEWALFDYSGEQIKEFATMQPVL